MRKVILSLFSLCVFVTAYGQDHKWAFGFYGDIQMEAPSYVGSFGVQGKYDLAKRSALQAQVNGRNGYVAVGADYLFSIMDKRKSNFDVFLGAGVSQDFYRYNELWTGTEHDIPEVRESFTMLNGQVGLSYYFPSVNLSVYTGYKAKFQFESEQFDPNYLMLGVRYHLW